MTHTLTPTPREQSIRVPVLWGLAFGAIQAASPLAIWWLDQATVQALLLALIAAITLSSSYEPARAIAGHVPGAAPRQAVLEAVGDVRRHRRGDAQPG
jgi:hypothetical protein